MRKIITLLGDQAAPLLLLVATVKEPCQIHILTSCERRGRARNMQEALADFAQVKQVRVHETAYHDMAAVSAVAAAIIGDGEGVLADITGGTKIMALGLFAAAKESRATILYVDTAGRRILDVTQPQHSRVLVQGFQEPIFSDTVLRAYGKKVHRVEQECLPEGLLQRLLEYISRDIGRWLEFWKRYTALLRNRTKSQSNQVAIPIGMVIERSRQVMMFLVQNGFVKVCQEGAREYYMAANTQIADYLRRGSWLEDLVYYKLQHFFFEVRKNVKILVPKPLEQVRAGEFPWYVENEVDVLVNEKGVLLFIECKAGQGKSVLSNIASELAKIEEIPEKNGGFFAQSALVLPYARAQLTSEFLVKTKTRGIHVFCLEDLDRLEQGIAGLLGCSVEKTEGS